jgi:hypothetical protein
VCLQLRAIGIVIKGVTNPNGVLSGVTCIIIGQNRARTPNIVQYVYIPYFNVTSGGIRCSKGTPIIKKPNPSLFIRGTTEKTKALTLNKYMAMGPSGARCQESPCWLVAGRKLLLCSKFLYQCGDGVEYLHRHPATRRRRRKGKSQI